MISINSPPFREGQEEGLLPFMGGEYCADYKLIIVLIVIDEKFLLRKKYDLPIHPYIIALSN